MNSNLAKMYLIVDGVVPLGSLYSSLIVNQ